MKKNIIESQNLRKIRKEISEQNPKVEIVVVSKTQEVDKIQKLYEEENQIHFGENYVKEQIDKTNKCSKEVKWHFIGHQQSNKISQQQDNVPNQYMIESIDSKELIIKQDKYLQKKKESMIYMPQRIQIQVNTSGVKNQSGIEPEKVSELYKYINTNYNTIKAIGLMTINKNDNPPTDECFILLNEQSNKIKEEFAIDDSNEWIISMGMSQDYMQAISKGSNQVRLGSCIFGPRKNKN